MLRMIKYCTGCILLLLTLSSTYADIIKELPQIGVLKPQQYGGYVSISANKCKKTNCPNEPSLYYWYIPADTNSDNKPLIVWFNGGPGSSSMYGPLMEIGPHIFTGHGKLVNNPYSWTKIANIMIIEQPLSVGASVVTHKKQAPHNNNASSKHLYNALQHVLTLFPQLRYHPVYLAGESYAGTTLAYLAEEILKHKKPGFQLGGLILNDAWINPIVQMSYDTTYAFTHGMIDLQQKHAVDQMFQKCSAMIKQQTPSSAASSSYCQGIMSSIKAISGLYLPNIMKTKPDYSLMQNYLSMTTTQQAMHMKLHSPYVLYSRTIANNYMIGEQDSVAKMYNDILSKDIPVMIMSGLLDATDCNFLGVSATIAGFDWPGKQQYLQAKTSQWRDKQNKTVLGYLRTGGGLTRLKVLNGGHMLPMDQPKVRDMVEAFIDL